MKNFIVRRHFDLRIYGINLTVWRFEKVLLGFDPQGLELRLGANWVDILFLFWPSGFQECVEDQSFAF